MLNLKENVEKVVITEKEEVDGKLESVERKYEYKQPDGYMAFSPEEVADGCFKTFTDLLDKMCMPYIVKSDGCCRLVWYFEDYDKDLEFLAVSPNW